MNASSEPKNVPPSVRPDAREIQAFKDSSADAVAATAFHQAGDDVPTLLNGADTLTFAALAAGVRGIVWGASSIIPGPCVELHRLLIEGPQPRRCAGAVGQDLADLRLPRVDRLRGRREGGLPARRPVNRAGASAAPRSVGCG